MTRVIGGWGDAGRWGDEEMRRWEDGKMERR